MTTFDQGLDGDEITDDHLLDENAKLREEVARLKALQEAGDPPSPSVPDPRVAASAALAEQLAAIDPNDPNGAQKAAAVAYSYNDMMQAGGLPMAGDELEAETRTYNAAVAALDPRDPSSPQQAAELHRLYLARTRQYGA